MKRTIATTPLIYALIGAMGATVSYLMPINISMSATILSRESACTKHVMDTLDKLAELVKQHANSVSIGASLGPRPDNYLCNSLNLMTLARRPELTRMEYDPHVIWFDGMYRQSGGAAYFGFRLNVDTSKLIDSYFHYEVI